ncbi:MAG: bifunctional precorrin-2 dehydrogenase/sirohydrochlorin ferrochelatase [Clostridia bacterium]|nr:bifunctional precorrin-2 dehydrogenase/sirohydrochlorin ferrochelatase [Clostridia bacterium]
MTFNYPVSLNISQKRCLVVGGGKVALRKIGTLLEAGGEVLVISRKVLPEIKKLVDEEKIKWVSQEINYELLKNCFLVIAATNNRDINRQIAEFCQRNSILVNVVDSLEESSFIVNSYLKQGDLTIAVSTNGKSPALAKKIKSDLSKLFGPEYGLLLEILAEARELAKVHITDESKRNQFFREIVTSDILEFIQERGLDEARERVKTCLLSY